MELKILKEEEAPLLSRRKIVADVAFSGATPSKKDIWKQLASHLKTDEKLIVVKNIYTSFGNQQAQVVALQYMSEEEMKRIEPVRKEKAKAGEKKEGAGEQAVPEKKEAKKEEKK